MAGSRIKGITVEIGGDTTGLDKALSGTNKEIGNTQKQLKDVERLLKLDPSNTKLLEQRHRLLGDAVAETKGKLETLKEAEKQVQEQFERGEVSREQYDALQREIAETEQSLRDLERQAGQSYTALQEISIFGEKLEKAGSAIEGVGQKLMPVTAAVGGLGAAAVTTAADFDAAMSQVEAISGASGEELEALRNKAREMGASTKFSASEAAEAMQYMAMAGWDVENMMGGITGVMNLAAASGEDLASVSDIVTDAMTAFGLSASETSTIMKDDLEIEVDNTTRFVDALAAASNSSNTNVAMLGESFKYVAPAAGALGYSVEDAAVALGLMANQGIKASQSGTALRTILTNMANPTDTMAMAMDALGLSLERDDGSTKSLMEVMLDLRKGFGEGSIDVDEFSNRMAQLQTQFDNGKISEDEYAEGVENLIVAMYGAEGAQKAQYAAMLAGKTGMAGLLAIVNTGEEDFNNLADAIYNANGTSQEMADIMQDNLEGQMTILKSQLEELAISFGEILMPAIRDIVGKVQEFIDWLNNMDEGTKETIIQVALLAAAIGPLLIVVGKVISAVGTIMQLAPKLGEAIYFLANNPIVLIIAAIAGLVALIAAKGDEIQAILQKVDDFLQNIFAVDWTNVFGPVLGEALNVLFANVKNIWDSIKRIFDGIIDFIRGVFTGDWQRAWEGVKNIFGGIFDGLIAIAKAPLNGIIGILNGLISGLNTLISGLNQIHIDVPDWVPAIGGKSFGIHIGQIGKIPYLAKGGVLSQGSAVVGEAGPELLTMAGNRAIVQPLTNQYTTNKNLGGISVYVYGAPGQNVRELAEMVGEEIQNAIERREAAFS